MSFVAIAVGGSAVAGIATGVGSALSARESRKAQQDARDQEVASLAQLSQLRQRLTNEALEGSFLDRFGSADIFGRRGGEFDLAAAVQRATLVDQGSIGSATRLTDRANQAITESAIRRAALIDPNIRQNFAVMSEDARALLRGEISPDVISSIRRARAEGAAGGVGVIGAQRAATSRDLGLTSIDNKQRGQSLFAQIIQARQAIDPMERSISQSRYLLSPEQQLQIGVANQALRSAPDPAAVGLFDLQLRGGREEALAQKGLTIPQDNTLGAGFSGLGGAISGLTPTLISALSLSRRQQQQQGLGTSLF